MRGGTSPVLERSCTTNGNRDWIRLAPPQPGLERLEAFFTGHAYEPHRHETYAIGYTVRGVQSFGYRGAQTNSTPGDVIVLHPDATHDGHAGAEAGFCYRMLYVEPRLVQIALGDAARTLPFVKTAVSSDARLLRVLRPALDDLEHPLEALEVDHLVTRLAQSLLQMDASLPPPRTLRPCAIATERAREYLHDRSEQVVTSEQLEAVTGLDRYQLARQFRARFGTSPYRYLTFCRLEQAKRLLRTGATTAEAALCAGFADQSHMTRQFKRAHGLPPAKWRRLLA